MLYRTDKKNQGFEELEVYKVAREFRKKMYSVAKRLSEIKPRSLDGLADLLASSAPPITNYQLPINNHRSP
jgi:hypothetical protein